MDAAEIVNKAAADLAPMTVKDYLDDIGEFLDDAEHFELADDSTVDITPALNGLRAVEAQIESDAKVIAALREALYECANLARGWTDRIAEAPDYLETIYQVACQATGEEAKPLSNEQTDEEST